MYGGFRGNKMVSVEFSYKYASYPGVIFKIVNN